jgi:hypothetical protein
VAAVLAAPMSLKARTLLMTAYAVGADLKLTQPTDLSLTRGWVPAL